MATILDQVLLAATEEDLESSWATFFLNVEHVRAALARTKDELVSLLQKGAGVKKTPFTTTTIAVKLQALTKVAYVATTWTEYNTAFIYSVALAAEVDPGNLILTERQADVSFALARCWQGREDAAVLPGDAAGGAGGAGARTAANGADAEMPAEEEEDQDEDGAAPLSWEEQADPLPGDLAQAYSRLQAGSLQLDARAVLEACPRWAQLKQKAESNNHRSDGARPLDRVLKQAQQKVLGLQRMYPVLHQHLHTEGEEGECWSWPSSSGRSCWSSRSGCW